MVERMWLTPDVVDALPPPGRGERWIADTQVRGFGLRLWPTGRAYAIRVSDQAGRAIRRSFAPDWARDRRDWDMDRAFSRSPGDEYAPRLGRLLDAAREWARVEIARAKGRGESAEAEAVRLAKAEVARAAERARLAEWTLGESAIWFIEAGDKRGWSRDYQDRMRSLFHAHVRATLQERRLVDLGSDDYRALLLLPELTDGTARALRGLLGQILRAVEEAGGLRVSRPLHALRNLAAHRPMSEAARFAEAQAAQGYGDLFAALDHPSIAWPVSLCLQLSLWTRAPHARVMRAEWRQIAEGYWFYLHPSESPRWRFRFERVEGNIKVLLNRAEANATGLPVQSPYVFPSLRDPSSPISRTDHVWFAVLRRLGWPKAGVRTYSAPFCMIGGNG